jgi:hypothetical protein
MDDNVVLPSSRNENYSIDTEYSVEQKNVFTQPDSSNSITFWTDTKTLCDRLTVLVFLRNAGATGCKNEIVNITKDLRKRGCERFLEKFSNLY